MNIPALVQALEKQGWVFHGYNRNGAKLRAGTGGITMAKRCDIPAGVHVEW